MNEWTQTSTNPLDDVEEYAWFMLLPDPPRLSPTASRSLAMSSAATDFDITPDENLLHFCLFVADEEYLGRGLESIANGDEVWIIHDTQVLLLLRPVADRDPPEYRLVGEAYVHGIMHGEMLYGTRGVFTELVRIF